MVANIEELPTSSWQALPALIVIVVLARLLYTLFFSPFKDIPGPFAAKFTRVWQFFNLRASADMPQVLLDLHKKHGPIVRVGPNMFSFNSLEDNKKIYGSGKGFVKSSFYLAAEMPGDSNLFSLRDEVEHASRKKDLAKLYTMSSMVHYEPAVDKTTAVLLAKLRELAESGEAVLVLDLLQRFAFDVIGEITVNKSFGLMRHDPRTSDYIRLVHSLVDYFPTIGIFPEFHLPLIKLSQLLGGGSPTLEIEEFLRAQLDTASSVADEESIATPSFLTKIVGLQRAGKVRHRHVLDTLGANIAAGSDTTGITLSAALYHLYRNPRQLAKLRQEIDSQARAGALSDPPTFAETQQMPYLQAVLREVLRIHPAIGYLLSRVVPSGGAILGGHYFPAGTQVGMSPWALHRNPDVFGPDADDFRPERFLEDGDKYPGVRSSSSLASSFAFGGGSRTCLGKNISILEISKAIPQIVRHFDLEFPDGKDWSLYCLWHVYPRFHCRVAVHKN